jgi:hypothetical protein
MKKITQELSIYFFFFRFTRVSLDKFIAANIPIAFPRFPTIRLDARDCLRECKRTVVDNAACRRQLNRP